MLLQSLTPLIPPLLIAAIRLAIPDGAIERRWVRLTVLGGLTLLIGRYLHWRLFVTVLPANDLSAQTAPVWSIFAIELVAWFDAGVGFLALSRKTDRRAEADRHEARLRAADPWSLPVVDVMIATYNEPLDVLEKTIIGAVGIDWPRDRLRVWVLDDGDRPWLEAFAREMGAGYLTRTGNAHAKAGNINNGIARTSGEFFLVLDADFVPRRNFLYRAIGFFEDDRIGIVQIPHSFFNSDPMQSSLGMQRDMPDDQRFFFDAIMPGRDGWDCAFCCGSNGIVRRSAIAEIGGALPSGSITEDMLLTLALLRKGYVTRYLNERLAIGLAPESLAAFFVQRARWARGAIQLLYLREGPLGPGLTPIQRAMFLPTHWITQSLSQIVAMSTPAIYLLTGLLPLLNTDASSIFSYQLAAIVGAVMGVRLFAPSQYNPIAATAHGVLQAFRLLPTILVTLIRPHGHAFKVTPKGKDAGGGARIDRPTVVLATGLTLATAAGLILNTSFEYRVIETGALVPIVAFWAVFNMVIMTIVAAIAVSPPALRAEERFDLDEPIRLRTRTARLTGTTRDLSLAGAAVTVPDGDLPERGDWLLVGIAGVGHLPAEIMRRAVGAGGETTLGLRFHIEPGPKRVALIGKLFTGELDNSPRDIRARRVTLGLIGNAFGRARPGPERAQVRAAPPDWLRALEADHGVAAELDRWAEDLEAERAASAARDRAA